MEAKGLEDPGGNNKFHPEHILTALFSYMEEEKFEVKFRMFFKGIHALQQEDKYKPFLKDFIFSERGRYPYSELLDNAMFRLNEACVLKISNPEYSEYEITHDQKEAIQKMIVKKYFSPEQQEILKEMSNKFEEYLTR